MKDKKAIVQLARTLAAMSVAAVATLIAVPPAHAAPAEWYQNAATLKCIRALTSGDDVAWLGACSTNWYLWEVINKGTSPAGQRKRQLKNVANNRCLDSHAGGANAQVWVIGCNTGEYQQWEIFVRGNYLIFKSWGAWILQGNHLCMAARPQDNSLRLAECDVNSPYQRFQ